MVSEIALLSLENTMKCSFPSADPVLVERLDAVQEGTTAIYERALQSAASCWYSPELISQLEKAWCEGQIFQSARGYIRKTEGTFPQEGDLIGVLLGSQVPHILRKVDDHYIVICDAYVDGIMNGEVMDAFERGEVELQDLVLH
jgi:hypothetical protein